MSGQLDSVENREQRHVSGNKALNRGNATRGTADPANVKFITAVDYSRNGVLGQAVAAELDISVTTQLSEEGYTVQRDDGIPKAMVNKPVPAGIYCKYLICFNGTEYAFIQGEFFDDPGVPYYPSCPPSYVPIFVVTLNNETGGEVTLGTTSLATSNLTDTYEDVAVVPARYPA